MAGESNKVPGNIHKDATNDRLAKAKATRAANAEKHVALDVRNRFSLNMLQQASRGCKILSEKIRCGEPVDSATLQAAATLSAVAASSM